MSDPNSNLDPWDATDAMESLKMERTMSGGLESEEDLARRLLRESVANATQTIIYIALNDGNSRMRYQASTYILDRVLGRIGDQPQEQADWVKMLEEAMAQTQTPEA